MTRSALMLAALLLAAAWARGVEVSRTLKTFDFEERRLGNQGDLPIGWTKVAGPGLPHYVNGKLANDRKHSGDWSFRFDLNGGGLIYRYPAKLLKVQFGAHYRISAYCQTTPLPHARTRMTAYFADLDGHSIETSVRHSALYASPADAPDEWRRLSIELSDDVPQADSLVIELELLQPSQYLEHKPQDPTLFEQDIYGSAWWDDVQVAQVPQIALGTDHSMNLFRRGEPVRLWMRVNDLVADDLFARISIRDAEGREVYQRTERPDVGAADSAKRIWFDLPQMLVGWYQVSLVVSSGRQVLDRQSINLAVIADDVRSAGPDRRFGLIATGLPFEQWEELPPLLQTMGVGRVKLAVWSDQGDVEQSHGIAFDRLLQQLSDGGMSLTACLASPPPKLRAKLDGGGWERLPKVSPDDWQPDLAFIVSRHANHVEQWQLGLDGSDAFATDRADRDAFDRVRAQFAQLISAPNLEMPWPAYYEAPAERSRAVAISVPASVLPSQVPLYVQDLKSRGPKAGSITLQPLDRARYGREVQVRDLAQRVIYALTAEAPRIDLPLPVSLAGNAERDSPQPDELLTVERTLFTTLGGTQYRGRVAIGDGIEAFLFDRGSEGIIALWGQGDPSRPRELTLNLGDRPRRLDLWGNSAPLLQPRGERAGRVLIDVGTMPIFLVDIDGHQAQLRASVAIDRPLLESAFRPHDRRIRFVNAYDHPISGSLHLHGPDGWTLNPPTFSFNLNPGETFDKPFTIQFPYNSVAGAKAIGCEFLIEGEKNPTFDVPLTMKLGLSDVGMQTIAVRNGRDVFVQQVITNYGDRPINYSAFALCPGQARQERVVMNLPPGQTTIRRYRFENVPRAQRGWVRAGLKELQGARILNDAVAMP